MLTFLWSFIAFVIALGVLITVHESGHFIAARYYGVKVERFSIGFGKVLWRHTDCQGTEYVISLIPLGGYVKMLEEHISTTKNKSLESIHYHCSFNNKTVLQRAMIIIAGPLANFIFSLFVYWIVFLFGISGFRPVISEIIKGSIAEKYHIISGMEIKKIDNIKIPDWNTARMIMLSKIGNNKTTFTVSTVSNNTFLKKQINLRHWKFTSNNKQDPFISLGIMRHTSKITMIIANILKDSPAYATGLQIGDKLSKIDNIPLINWQTFSNLIELYSKKNMILEVERNSKPIKLMLIAKKEKSSLKNKKEEKFIGIVPLIIPLPDEYKITTYYEPLNAITQSITKTWQLVKLTTSMLGKLLIGNIKLSNLSGPISIAQGAGLSAKYGISYYMMFLTVISINLGIINLFPLPVLDGGHLLFLAIEKIKGKPVSKQVHEFSYRIGSIMLILLMGLAILNDFSRL